MYDSIDWENVWLALLTLVIVLGIGLGTFAMVQPHVVDGYYASQGCVWAHWTWHGDERVMCPNDVNTLPELTERFTHTAGGK
jgi:hypothetical protein